ncbi:MAG: hypothetical protein FJ050_07350, partial [Cyanobacteria bacterium M_surface_7_m2_040]|nr:hypothetical protein [Cyanobacteria bacterium M_surface_7_m2_040]
MANYTTTKIVSPDQIFNVSTLAANQTVKLQGGKSKNLPSLILAFTNGLRTAQSDGAGTTTFAAIPDGVKSKNGNITFSFEGGRTVIVGKKLYGFAQKLFTTTPDDGQLFESAVAWSAYAQANTGGPAAPAPAGQTFTLTTGVDNLTGTSGSDTFIADNTGTDTSSTADSLNGGAGTDTLNIYSDGAAGAMPALTSIETVNIYDQDADINVSSSSWSSVTALNLIRGDGATVTVGANVDTIGLTDIVVPSAGGSDNDVILNFGADRTSATLNLSGITSAAAAADENIHVNGAALTSLTVNVNTASEFDNLDADAATSIAINAAGNLTTVLATTGTATLSISGAGAVNIGVLDDDIDTVISTATGALTAAIGNNVDTVLTAGSGNDVITAS